MGRSVLQTVAQNATVDDVITKIYFREVFRGGGSQTRRAKAGRRFIGGGSNEPTPQTWSCVGFIYRLGWVGSVILIVWVGLYCKSIADCTSYGERAILARFWLA